MKLFKFLVRKTFNLIGGIMTGLSIPFGSSILYKNNSLIDFVVFFPLAILFLGVSYYYSFIEKD
jgi:hypothetical protein